MYFWKEIVFCDEFMTHFVSSFSLCYSLFVGFTCGDGLGFPGRGFLFWLSLGGPSLQL